MATTLAKEFEAKVKEDWLKLGNVSIDRLYDPEGGYFGISNISDFIAYHYPSIYYLEVKTIKGNTFPLSNLKQYDKLIKKKGIKGVNAGVIIWFYEHENKIIYVPIEVIEQLKKDEKKSFNVKYIDSKEYFCIPIPSVKKRTYYDSDYSILLQVDENGRLYQSDRELNEKA